MNTLVLYYSYSGHTKVIAEELASKESADIQEIRDVRRPGTFKAYTLGCFASMGGKAWAIEPLEADIAKYDRLILLAPIWAGYPAPALNAVLETLPKGKDVALKMVSGSGRSNSACRARVEAVIENKGCAMESFENIKA